MTRSSFLTAAILLLATASPALADGRADWQDYAWQQIKLSQCVAQAKEVACPLYHQKWDWKRDQWVDVAIAIDLAGGQLRLTQRLTNKAPTDDDDVCVTAIAVDAQGRNIIAHHQNWHSNPGDIREESFLYQSSALDSIDAILIGSKQCRDGDTQDDGLYARVLAGIQR